MSSSAVATGMSASARLASPAAALWHKDSSFSRVIMSGSVNEPTAVRRSAETCQRPHVGALAALGGEYRVIGVRRRDDVEMVDLHGARRELDLLAVARDVVG